MANGVTSSRKRKTSLGASSRAGRLKQINIDTIRIGEHDLEIKINRAKDFLKEGNKVQFTLRFKGREMAHLDLGRVLFVKIKTELFLVSKVERDAKMEGKRMTLVLQPDHKDPSKLKEAQAPAAPPCAGSGLNIPIGAARAGATSPGSPTTGAAPVAPRPVGATVATASAPRPAASAPVAPRPAVTPAPSPRPTPAPATT